MVISQQLLDILVCPQCKGPLSMVEGGRGLLCESCQLKYPVRDNIPIMSMEEAVDLRKAAQKAVSKRSANVPSATFKIIDGPNKGLVFHLEMGTCKAVGRAMSDPNKTAMFNVDLTLALDESTKGLVLKYVTRQFRKSAKEKGADVSDELGAFKRTSDITLDDSSTSRLHAMLFYDEVGVGVLDLVSKNGTFVNGEEVESRLLRMGDAIEIGESKMVFEK
jgi:hypothetical protein